jgi:hypothetical protein
MTQSHAGRRRQLVGLIGSAGAAALAGSPRAALSATLLAERPSIQPAWLKAAPANRWLPIAGSELTSSGCAAQLAAALTDAQCRDIGFGHPHRGIVAFSGGALKRAGSEMLLFGGGGAGAWAGNDVRAFRLEDDQPRWRTRVTPSPAGNVWPRTHPPTPYMRDGIAPNARHSYWQPQFIDAANRLMTFGCVNTWNADSGQFLTVDGVEIDKGRWDPPGTYPPLPVRRGWDGNWICKDPLTESVYVSGNNAVWRWQPASNTWSVVWSNAKAGVDRATAAIDPNGNGTLLRIGAYGKDNVPVALDLKTGEASVGELTGPHAKSINVGGYYAAGLVFDAGLGTFVLFQDDGHLYTIARASTADWNVDRLPMTGTAPPPTPSAREGRPALWGRFQYVPNLKGVCIVQSHDRPVYFVRTSQVLATARLKHR